MLFDPGAADSVSQYSGHTEPGVTSLAESVLRVTLAEQLLKLGCRHWL